MYTFSRSRDEITQLIREQGLTPTVQRVKIGMALLNKPQHLSADEVLKIVNADEPKVSKATVYNTLKAFIEHSLVKQVKISNQHLIYDSVVEAHHHIYNEDTGDLTDINPCQIHVDGLPELSHGLVTRGIEVLVRVGNS